MKKKLIALAVAAALAPAAAMADTSNVTVYGIADASFDSVRNGGATSVTVSKVSSNASRLGLKGSEDLGGGLKAVWQIETGISMDAGGNTLATRNTFVGLAGDSWGSLTLGNNDTPYKSSTRGMDVFMDHIADNRTLMGGAAAAGALAPSAAHNARSGFDQRFTNTVRYDSPAMSGFKAAAAYTVSSETNVTSAADVKAKAVSLSGSYATGPFNAAVAYQKNTFGSLTTGGSVSTAAAAGLSDEKAWKVAGGYKVDQFGVNAVYEKTTDSLGSGAGGLGHKAYYVSGVFNATANDAIKLAYTKAKNLADGSAANTGAKQWSLGVDHNMSKRTTVYAMYTKLDNDSVAMYSLSLAGASTGAQAAPVAGADPSAFSLGIKHAF